MKPDVTLKAKFLLLISAATLLALLLSEWLTVGLTETVLKRHELEMRAQYGNSVLVESMERDGKTLLDHLVLVHLLVAAITVCLLVVVLHIAWKHLVHKRLSTLLLHMSRMEHGTWQAEVRDASNDELAAVAEAVNRLGSRLTTATQQFGDASKLAALALIGQTLLRDVLEAHDQLCGTAAMLKLGKDHNHEALRPVTQSLDSLIRILERIPKRFQKEFDREFRQQAKAGSKPRDAAIRGSGTLHAPTSSEGEQGA